MSKELKSFIAYYKAHPEQRFWQALRNWSGYAYIYGSMVKLEDKLDSLMGLEDTFYK